MNVNYKKVRKPLFLTLLLFSLGTFCVFSTTASKYLVVKSNFLKYDVSYKKYDNLKQNEWTLEKDPNATSAPDTVGFIVTFRRSNYALPTDEAIKYTFKVGQEACKITKSSPASAFENTNNDNEATLILNANTTAKNIKVYYTCSADDIIVEKGSEKSLTTTFTVTEQFKQKDSSTYEDMIYELGKTTFNYDYSLFYNLYLHVETDEDGNKTYYIPKDYNTDKRYDLIKSSFIVDKDEQTYFLTKYSSASKIEKDQGLKEFSIGKTANGDYYTYTKSKNFKAYAYTANGNGKNLYFVDLNSNILPIDDIVTLLREYLDENGLNCYPAYLSDDKKKIINYIESFKPTITELLKSGTEGSIRGIKYWNDGSISFESNIMTFVNASEPIEFSYENTWVETATILNNRLSSLYSTTINRAISTDLRPELQKTPPTTEKYTYFGPYEDGTKKVYAILHAMPSGSSGTYQLFVIEVEEDRVYELSFSQIYNEDNSVDYASTISAINSVLGGFKEGIRIKLDGTSYVADKGVASVTIDNTTNIIKVEFTNK